MNLLSRDAPRGWRLKVLITLIVGALLLAPFLFPGSKPLGVAEKICVMALLAASYDLLLGYSGIVSFAHVMFFGIGSYGVGLALFALGPGWGPIVLGAAAGLALAALLAFVVGLLSLRVQAIFFAMVTLAIAYAFNVLASQLPSVTGGDDGRSFQIPDVLKPGFKLFEFPSFSLGQPFGIPLGDFHGVAVNGRTLAYYLVFFACAILFLMLLRIVNSPFGRVLQAIRENPFRAEALGYRIVIHRTLATCLAAAVAAAAGGLNAIWLRYVGPDTALSSSIQIDLLVIVVIGGMGTLYGAILGAALFVIAENYLQALIGQISQSAGTLGFPLLAQILHPDRWLMWLGLMFILAVYFAPTGIYGKLRRDG
jgi:branched-chain amino acid transport system permease protein